MNVSCINLTQGCLPRCIIIPIRSRVKVAAQVTHSSSYVLYNACIIQYFFKSWMHLESRKFSSGFQLLSQSQLPGQATNYTPILVPFSHERFRFDLYRNCSAFA
jgi:hypothetical protein